MCQLLKIDSVLECIVCCVAVSNIDGYVVIVTVGEVNIVAVVPRCSVGTRHFVVVNFNPNVVCITQAVLECTLASICVTTAHPAASSKRI